VSLKVTYVHILAVFYCRLDIEGRFDFDTHHKRTWHYSKSALIVISLKVWGCVRLWGAKLTCMLRFHDSQSRNISDTATTTSNLARLHVFLEP
jgi:hypothetical protein